MMIYIVDKPVDNLWCELRLRIDGLRVVVESICNCVTTVVLVVTCFVRRNIL